MTDIKQYEPLWGGYIESLVGESTYGKVYRLCHEEFGEVRFSAVKLVSVPHDEADFRELRAKGMDDGALKSYFHGIVTDLVRDAELMSEFKDNSNIVSIEDFKVFSKTDGIGYDLLIRMELLKSLSSHIDEKPMRRSEVVKLGIHICRALEIFESENIIHCDIKPDNIFISQSGDYKLGDFGAARYIEGTPIGLKKKTDTELYMAPELWNGNTYSPNVDTYSLGLLMYRLLNQNRFPFLPESPSKISPKDREEAMWRRMQGEPLPKIVGIAPELSAIVLSACNYDPGRRFASPAKMREALEALSGEKAQAPVLMPVQTSPKPVIARSEVRTETVAPPRSAAPKISAVDNYAYKAEAYPRAKRPALPVKKKNNAVIIACASIAAIAIIAVLLMWSGLIGDTEPETVVLAPDEPVVSPEPNYPQASEYEPVELEETTQDRLKKAMAEHVAAYYFGDEISAFPVEASTFSVFLCNMFALLAHHYPLGMVITSFVYEDTSVRIDRSSLPGLGHAGNSHIFVQQHSTILYAILRADGNQSPELREFFIDFSSYGFDIVLEGFQEGRWIPVGDSRILSLDAQELFNSLNGFDEAAHFHDERMRFVSNDNGFMEPMRFSSAASVHAALQDPGFHFSYTRVLVEFVSFTWYRDRALEDSIVGNWSGIYTNVAGRRHGMDLEVWRYNERILRARIALRHGPDSGATTAFPIYWANVSYCVDTHAFFVDYQGYEVLPPGWVFQDSIVLVLHLRGDRLSGAFEATGETVDLDRTSWF